MSFDLNIAKAGKPHGVRGWLNVYPHNPQSDLLKRLKRVELHLPDGTKRQVDIEASRESNTGWLIKLSNVEDRDQARLLTHALLYCSSDLLAPLEEDEFYFAEVIGFDVVDKQGRSYGQVDEVLSTNVDVFVVRSEESEYMVPVVEDFVETIDREKRRIVVQNLVDELKNE